MKQLLQRFDTGETMLMDVPTPGASGPNVLIRSQASVISAGTERMLVQFGRSNLLSKARSQPDKVRQVLSKMSTDGIASTMDAVKSKLEMPIPLGYCSAGIVVETGSNAGSLRVGDRVVSNGPHAEYVRVPHTLVARVPDGVEMDSAAFTPIAAIGLQGIRLVNPTLGETVAVVGLGLIGLLVVQMLRANGCRVVGIDKDPARLRLAESFGAVAMEADAAVPSRVRALTGGIGADAVILALASTSDEPIHQAADMCRKRGRIVLVGVTGLGLVRDDFYKKELTFSVSCSFGPGRYDPTYEEAAQDYPIGYVRWTEQRNFEAVLALMESGQLDPRPLISHRYSFDAAPEAYEVVAGSEPCLGVLLQYPQSDAVALRSRTMVLQESSGGPASPGTVGIIGAGNFAVRTLLPELQGARLRLRAIASSTGVSGAIAARKFSIEKVTTDLEDILGDEQIDTVFILTRHSTHAQLVIRALRSGKHVFVEKPLALTHEELDAVSVAAGETDRKLLVGFNRRFAPLTSELRTLLRGRAGPLTIVATINAGAIPRDHWTQDPAVGGGRIVGEACHWLDLARSLIGAPIASLEVVAARDSLGRVIDDIAHLSVLFEDGSTAAVNYISSGAPGFPKERIDCFWDGRTATIENWRLLRRYGMSGPLVPLRGRVDKGHGAEVAQWSEAIRGGTDSPIPLSELFEVSSWAIRAADKARSGGN